MRNMSNGSSFNLRYSLELDFYFSGNMLWGIVTPFWMWDLGTKLKYNNNKQQIYNKKGMIGLQSVEIPKTNRANQFHWLVWVDPCNPCNPIN